MGACRQILAGHVLVVFFVSVLQTCSAATSRALPGIVGVWDRSNATWNSLYPASLFRDDSVREYFDIWPEDNSLTKFKYYCEDPVKGSLSLRNFTYSTNKGRLVRVPYYDLGIVQPYWKYWLFGKVNIKRISYSINCEYNDLSGLYAERYLFVTMKNGFIAAAVMLGIIQFIVAIVVTAMWTWRFLRCSRAQTRAYLKVWFWNSQWQDYFSEVLHLTFLVPAGYCMMEAMGHSDLHTWRSRVMYNMGVLYSYLSLSAVVSSVFRQIACCWMDPANIAKFELLRQQSVLTIQANSLWVLLQGIYDDWVWQRVMGQAMFVVMSCIYLSRVDDSFEGGRDQMALCIWLASLVVSGTWSFGAAALVMIQSISHILAPTFPFAKCGIRRVSTDDGGEGKLDEGGVSYGSGGGGEALPRAYSVMRSQSHEPNSESDGVLPPFPSKAGRSENIDEITMEVHVEEQPQEQEQCTKVHMRQEFQIIDYCKKITRFQVCVRAAVGFSLWFTFWFIWSFGTYVYKSYSRLPDLLIVMIQIIGLYWMAMHNHIFSRGEMKLVTLERPERPE